MILMLLRLLKARWKDSMHHIVIHSKDQQLEFKHGEEVLALFSISTAKNGMGEEYGSEKTPRGHHRITAMYGDGMPSNTVFESRVATGELFNQGLFAAYPHRDWIISRIIWLDGLQAGFNKGGGVDTKSRYIYIHGTPDVDKIGLPCSHGCIRMRPEDIILLYAQVKVGCDVHIL